VVSGVFSSGAAANAERKARRWVGLKEDLREERQAPVLKRAGNL